MRFTERNYQMIPEQQQIDGVDNGEMIRYETSQITQLAKASQGVPITQQFALI